MLRSTRLAADTVLKGIVQVVGEVMRQRELARLKREAEERARLEQEAFVSFMKPLSILSRRNCVIDA